MVHTVPDTCNRPTLPHCWACFWVHCRWKEKSKFDNLCFLIIILIIKIIITTLFYEASHFRGSNLPCGPQSKQYIIYSLLYIHKRYKEFKIKANCLHNIRFFKKVLYNKLLNFKNNQRMSMLSIISLKNLMNLQFEFEREHLSKLLVLNRLDIFWRILGFVFWFTWMSSDQVEQFMSFVNVK